MRCVSRVTVPAYFEVMSNFTKKTRSVLRKQETRLLYFSFTLKTLQQFFFKKETEKLVSKETVASRCWGSET